jgi:RNA polymerase sigma factor (sigma-70 family)
MTSRVPPPRLQPELLMDKRPPTNVPGEEAFLIAVSAVARPYARLLTSRDDAFDIAQDVVLDCLTNLCDGGCPFDVMANVGLIKTMVLRRLLMLLRANDRRATRDAQHELERTDSTHIWMQPDLGVEAQELEDVLEKTIASLPRMCRRVYVMVRDDGASYQIVANVLGVSRASVNAHMVSAQRRLRVALIEQGPMPTTCRPERSEGPALVLHSPQQSGHSSERRHDAAA